MKVIFKIWLEENGVVAFSEGRKMLLEAIDRLGSLNAASKALGAKLLNVTTGGKGGGGAVLTQEAKELLSKYKKYKKRIAILTEKEFKRFFK